MKFSDSVSGAAIELSVILVCLYAFISPILVINNPGINEKTFIGVLGLVLIFSLMTLVIKKFWIKKDYSFLIPFVFLPSVALTAGFVVSLLY